jgi:hypothetical protein
MKKRDKIKHECETKNTCINLNEEINLEDLSVDGKRVD